MLNVNELIGFGAESNRPLEVVYNGMAETASVATIITIPNVPFGEPDESRIVVVSLRAANSLYYDTAQSVTIGGVAASSGGAPATHANLWWAVVPSGTSGDVVIDWNLDNAMAGRVTCHSVYGASSPTPTHVSQLSSLAPASALSITMTGALVGDVAVASMLLYNVTGIVITGTAGYDGDDYSFHTTPHSMRVGAFACTTAGGTVAMGTAVAGYRTLSVVSWR